jgi:hypothetical protein
MRGGMEAIYDAMPGSIGLGRFAKAVPARGAMFSARNRVGLQGESSRPAPITEDIRSPVD